MELVPQDYWGPSVDETYLHWDLATTFVVSGPLLHCTRGRDPSTYRGRVFTRAAARRWVAATYGRFEEIRHPRRWAFRVIKPGFPGGRYTPPGEA